MHRYTALPMRPPHHLAVVEDDPGLLQDMTEYLELRGFAARGFGSAEAFFEAWPAASFDLLLLDVVLPGESGLALAQRVRAQQVQAAGVGIVMLTALQASDDHVSGLEAGADVYLSKHSSLEVIEAACRSVLRRMDASGTARSAGAGAGAGADGEGRWCLNTRRWLLQAPDGACLDLTHTEVVLLGALFEQAGRTVSREELLERLGRRATLPGLRNLDNTASRLRRKVQAACGVELPVRPSYGQGYTFTGTCEMQA
jgi:DNA-binding response OmpR family regulator